jgi:DNA-binding CsgD family transcriptional regulator
MSRPGGGGAERAAATADVLLERDVELTAITAAVEGGTAGHGALLVVDAAAGLGKTRLLNAAVELASGAGLRGSAACGLEFERGTAFGVAQRLLTPLVGFQDDTWAAARLDPGQEVQRLFALLRNHVAQSGPLLLAVDDAHWSDSTSLRLLSQLAGHVHELAIVLILSMRPRDPIAPPELAALRSHPASQVLRPLPLSQLAIDRLVMDTYPDAPRAFVAACASASGGNPFLLRELLRALRDEDVDPNARTAARVGELVPDSVQQVVLTRIGRLFPPASAVALSLAVLGDRTPLHLVAAHAGLEIEAAEEAAEALIAADVLAEAEPLSFRHPLIGAAVRADLGRFAASRAHRRAAELLRARGEPPERIAPHLLSISPSGDRETVAVLRAAAEHASRRGETSTAMRLLSRALDEPSPPEWRTDILVDLALAGGVLAPEAREELGAALVAMPVSDPRRVPTTRALVKLLFRRGEYAQAAAAAEEGLQSVPVDNPLREDLLLDYMAVATFHPGCADRLNVLLDPLLAAARGGELPVSSALCGRVATRAGIAGDAALVRALAGRALAEERLPDDSTAALVFAFAAASLSYVDELQLAEAELTRALERARRIGSVAAAGVAGQCRALVRVPQGKLAGAAADVEDALALYAEGGGFFLGWCAPVLAHARIEQGDLPAAAEVLASSPVQEPRAMEDAFILDIAARLALEQGDPMAALAHLKVAGQFLAERFGIDHPAVLGWRPRAAVAASRAGLHDEARQLAEDALKQGADSGIPRLHGVALAAAGIVSGGDRGIELLTEAVEQLERSQAALERSHALVALGASLRRRGHLRDARDPLRRAFELAEAFGARPLARLALDELRSAGARPRRSSLSGVQSLTPSERRIAELAASGLSNRQIAAQLYLTSKTVEWHLGHVYGKLGISARAELARVLAAGAV